MHNYIQKKIHVAFDVIIKKKRLIQIGERTGIHVYIYIEEKLPSQVSVKK